MNNINIIYNNEPISDKKTNLYMEIFGQEPWNEGFICKKCGKNYNIEFKGKCSCGNETLQPFYETKKLKQEFAYQSQTKGYQEFLACTLNEYIGFTWGRSTNLESLNCNKLKLSNSQIKQLINNIQSFDKNFDLENFYYFAEIGVKKAFRKNGVASKLYQEKLKYLKEKGYQYMLVRTTEKSTMPINWFVNMGFKKIFSYNDDAQRVILVCKL